MSCSACGKAMAAGAKKCASCGTEASSSYSYDLMPEEPAKKKEEEAAPFALPEGAALPPPVTLGGGSDMGTGHQAPAKPKRTITPAGLNSGGGLTLKQISMGGVGVVAAIILFMAMCGGSGFKLTSGQPKGEGSGMLFSTGPRTINLQIIGKAKYTFTVEALDGDVAAGVVQRMSKDKVPPPAELAKAWNLTPVKKGESQTFTGTLESGSWTFAVGHESKKAVKIKYSYQLK